MPKTDALSILQICKKYPHPLKDGESIAIHNLSRSLVTAGARVSMLAMNTARHPYTGTDTPQAFNHYDRVEKVPVDNRIKPWAAFRNLFSADSYHISRFVSEAFAKKLTELLQRQSFDIIQLETIYLAPYIPIIRKYSNALICLRAHNLEHEIWKRIVRNTPAGPKRWYLQHLTAKLYRYEVNALQQVDLLAAITQRDLEAFQKLGFSGESVVCPIGLDLADYQRPDTQVNGHLSMGFIGSLDWMPNIEGLQWFLQNIWPEAYQQWPAVRLHIAGRNTPDWLTSRPDLGITVHGEVPDAADFINQHPIMVVPLLSGSGMRAKILEGMALGKVVITTKLGLEGIDAEPGQDVLVADNLGEFRQALGMVVQAPQQLTRIGERARALVATRYDSTRIGEQLLATYQQTWVDAVS